MTCTFFDCNETATREVTWMGIIGGAVVVGPVTHPYCETHATAFADHKATLTVIHERVLEVAR